MKEFDPKREFLFDYITVVAECTFAIAVIGSLFARDNSKNRGGSLFPCILVHSAINMFSTFANDTSLTTEMHLLHLVVLIVITVAYTLILTRMLPKKQWEHTNDV